MGLIIVSVASLFLIIIFSGLISGFNNDSRDLAHLEINIGNNRRAFEGEIIEGMTVLEAIQASALAGNIIFQYTADGNGRLVITSLDGYELKKSDQPLSFFLNNKKIDSAKIHSTLINGGDTMVIKSD